MNGNSLEAPKRKKRMNKTAETSNGEEDKLSCLPEPLLHHIFSFLDIREVMQTSFLSRKWRYFWKTLPVLNFDYSLWKPSSRTKKGTALRPLVKKVYAKDECMCFVDRVLLLREFASNLTKLHLSLYYCRDSGRLNTWLLFALTRHLKELYLDILRSQPYVVPDFLFTSSEIEVFNLKLSRLNACRVVSVELPNSICSAPRLRKLELDSVPLPYGDSSGELLLNYPLLEELVLNNCDHKHLQLLHISAPQLLKLVVDNHSSTIGSCKIRMSTPNLRLLHFNGSPYKDFSLCDLSSLAILKYSGYCWVLRENSTLRAQYVQSLIQALNGLHNIRTLELNGFDKGSPFSDCMFYQLLNPFLTLKCLELRVVPSGCIHYVVELLKRAPCLENLIVETAVYKEDNTKNFPLQSIFCNHLRHIKILNVKCSAEELMLLGHLLEYATVLQDITVCHTKSTRKEDLANFKTRIHSFAWTSQNVNLQFVEVENSNDRTGVGSFLIFGSE